MRSKLPRHLKSRLYANIILQHDLFNDWRIFCYKHPKIKSKVRSGSLFLNHKKMLFACVAIFLPVNMDSLEDYYYGD